MEKRGIVDAENTPPPSERPQPADKKASAEPPPVRQDVTDRLHERVKDALEK